MHLLSECLRALKYPAFWKREDCPSLIKFLESRLRDGDINDAKTEHHSYKTELNIIAKYYAESSEIAQKVQKWKDIFKATLFGSGKERVSVDEQAVNCMFVSNKQRTHQLPCQALFGRGKSAFLLKDKHSKEINLFWNLHQNIHTEIKLREEKAQLQQRKLNDLKDQISIEQTQHVLDTTKETLSQNLTLQKTVIKQHLLGEPNVENLELIIGQKRNCGSAFPKNKDTNLDYDDHERRYRQNSPQKRQCTEPIADAENNPFFESENNLDKEKDKSKSQSISSPENENTPLIHNNVEDESQQCNDDESYSEVSSNSYDEDYYSNCELSEEVKRLDVNDALIRNIFLEVLHQFRSKDLESGKSIMDSNVLNGIIDITDSRVKENGRIHIRYMVRPLPSVYLYNEFVNLKLPNTFNDMEQFSLDIKILMDFQKDVLKMVKSVNKPTINENVYKSEVETTPQKGKKAKRKGGVSA
ncbi:5566_t:CDS:10 [Funneliformis mosseae]|uniref:5566_t:CDS:1 n=1 Tax=Funneliformis mosseae TaxID=27381 RepID=A0A9N9DBA9_FUNMO|nr:5566_t:CDS:10 [Funneliformis mosseae]